MKDDGRPERKRDQPSEREPTSEAPQKIVAESIADEPQAVAYEPKFKSFSGQPNRFLPTAQKSDLPQAPRKTDASISEASDALATTTQAGQTDWFAQLLNRMRSANRLDTGDHGVSEFILEDKSAGKEHTADGERYIARLSYLHGLQAQLKDAKSEEEAERLQSLFSIEYMLQKARQIGVAALTQLGVMPTTPSETKSSDTTRNSADPIRTDTKPDGAKPADATFTTYDDFEKSVAHRHGLTDATLIGANPKADPERATDAIPPVASAGNETIRTGGERGNYHGQFNENLLAQAEKSKKSEVEQVPITHVKEFRDTPSAIVGEFRRILSSPERNSGEYHGAISKVEQRTFGSGLFFGKGFDFAGHEWHGGEPLAAIAQLKRDAVAYGLGKMQHGGKLESFSIAAILHSHPDRKDGNYDPWNFSKPDMDCADANDVPSYLLRPDNSVLLYKPHSGDRKGELVGHFDKSGAFVPEPKFAQFRGL